LTALIYSERVASVFSKDRFIEGLKKKLLLPTKPAYTCLDNFFGSAHFQFFGGIK
jgi:hypothetical protein